ncbi:MAG: hypothetical protein JXQ30_09150 [Spirochaetes bacterium]|nr:hypothetical protein [Spirochaetota bacterium]
MKILVFSDGKATKRFFSMMGVSKNHSVEYHACGDLKRVCKKVRNGTLVYYDIAGITDADLNTAVRYLEKLERIQYGIIDPKGAWPDVAELFYRGASDYVGKSLASTKLTEKRLASVFCFGTKNQKRGTYEEKEEKPDYIPSGNSWKNVKAGSEYTFIIMFVEIDDFGILKKQYSRSQLDTLLARFSDYLSYATEPNQGRIWMSVEPAFLLLFPFNGKRCSPLLTSVRMMLDRNIICAEDIGFNILLSYRIALHIGNIEYKKRGNTGNIVSDTINSIFHLGQKYAEPGGLYVTEEVFPFIPKGLDEYFPSAGMYEGRGIRRLRPRKP